MLMQLRNEMLVKSSDQQATISPTIMSK